MLQKTPQSVIQNEHNPRTQSTAVLLVFICLYCLGKFIASAIQGRATFDDLQTALEIREKNSTPDTQQTPEIKLGGFAEQIEDTVSRTLSTTSNLLFKLGRDGVMSSVVFGDPQSSSLRKVFDTWLETYTFQFGSKSVSFIFQFPKK